jgi:hypothetical protein
MRLVCRRGLRGRHYYNCSSMGMFMGILLFLSSWEPLTAFTWHAAFPSTGVFCNVRATTRMPTMIATTKHKLPNDASCFQRGRFTLKLVPQDDDSEDDTFDADDSHRDDQDDMNSRNDNQKSKTIQIMSKAKWKKKKFLMTRDVMTLIRNGDPSAPKKAQEMIHRMWTLYQKAKASSSDSQGDDGDSSQYFMPDTASYNLYINALAKSSSVDNPTAAAQAEQVLQNMREVGIRPNVVSYTSVMDAYAQQSAHDPTAAVSAERILLDLVEQSLPDDTTTGVTSVTADTVLNAWAQQGTEQGAARAQQILERLEEAAIGSRSSSIRPTAFSYATVIHGWAQVGGTVGAEKAQEVLDRLLQRLAKRTNKKDQTAVHPDTVVFNAVLHAWANSGDPTAGSKAVKLLNQMQELRVKHKYDCAPDTVSFNTALSAWSHCSHMNAATQAEHILQEMIAANREAPEHTPPPNTVSYNSVLHAWSQSLLPGAAERAEAVLEFMIRSQRTDIAPDVYSFTSVLNALAKSKEPNKAQRARARLDQLLEMSAISERDDPSLRPSQVTFNTVLNGCKYCIR